jgi:N-acyl-D-amino-acid deacylase
LATHEDAARDGNDRRGYDLVLTDATVVDGTGASAYAGDVALAGDRIAAIGPPNSLAGEVTVAVTGRVVAPGFIDIHSHADYTLLVDGRAHSATLQGVTSVVTGNCGHGIAPVTEDSRGLVPMNAIGWGARWEAPVRWNSFGEYLGLLRARGVAVNTFPLVPHGALRLAVSGFADRTASPSEIDTMRALADEAMAEGAVGLSTGLEYAPGMAASAEEIAQVAAPVGARGGLYATHCRDRAEGMAASAEESVRVAETAGARLQVSHFVRRPWAPEGVAERAMEVLARADERGISTRCDVFPFDFGPTPLAFLLPPWAREGDRQEIADRLAAPSVMRGILDGLSDRFRASLEGGMAETMYIACDGTDGDLVGRTLGQVARERDLGVAEAALWMLQRAGIDFYCVAAVERYVEWDDMLRALADPNFLIMSDGATGALDGPLAGYVFSLSDWGYAPEFLGRFVREQGLVPLADAIARMTSGPADQLGLNQRGRIAEDCFADLVVFDPATVGGTVAHDNLISAPTGIDHVLVNGRFVVRDGTPTDARPGVVGRRQ